MVNKKWKNKYRDTVKITTKYDELEGDDMPCVIPVHFPPWPVKIHYLETEHPEQGDECWMYSDMTRDGIESYINNMHIKQMTDIKVRLHLTSDEIALIIVEDAVIKTSEVNTIAVRVKYPYNLAKSMIESLNFLANINKTLMIEEWITFWDETISELEIMAENVEVGA